MPNLESNIQSKIIKSQVAVGVEIVKLSSTNKNGIPDLLRLERVEIDGKVYCVASCIEVKRDGEPRRALQKQTAYELRERLGMETVVMDSTGIVEDSDIIEAKISF